LSYPSKSGSADRSSPSQPPDISNYLAQPSEAEQEVRRLFRASETLVICDIGACEGEDSIRFARLFPRARVFAFEPLPANQTLIRANFTRYGVTNAELVPVALSDRAGEASFHVSSGRPSNLFAGENWNYGNKSSSLLPPASTSPMHGWIEFKETVKVRTMTLDAFCAERGLDRIDFIQMDVQGAEQMVLNGARTMLPRTTAIWLEVSDQELYKGQKLRTDIEAFMCSHGFTLGHTVRREIEGDQLYVNTRRIRVWPYLIKHRTRDSLRNARTLAGRTKRAVLDWTSRTPS
jgi:FkbM family methyltransferase